MRPTQKQHVHGACPELTLFAATFRRCWLCGARSHLQIHHAARGSFRARARTERCCLIRTCATCHDARLDGMPVVAQMALKHIYDPGFYDLVQFNRLRHRADHAITQADVDPWEQRFLASNQGMPYQ